jgi:hypothetical protein
MPRHPIQGPRPFYVIGHNTNWLDNVRWVLREGANAIEPDIQVEYLGDHLIVSHNPIPKHPPAGADHGGDWDSGMRADEFLRRVGDIARSQTHEGERLGLVILDTKIDESIVRPEHGRRLLQFAREGLAGTAVNLIISVPFWNRRALFTDIFDQLGPREGLMIDQADFAGTGTAGAVADWFWQLGVQNACYGYGPVGSSPMPVEVAIDHGVALKAQTCFPKWVYTYTLEKPDDMKDYIRAGVDGLIVRDRHVKTLANMITTDEDISKRVRLAQRGENPFETFPSCIPADTIFIRTMNRRDAGTNANVTFTLHGSGGDLRTTISGSNPKRFGRDCLNEISLYGDIGMPTALTIEHDGHDSHHDWVPDVVLVRRADDVQTYGAGFGDWIPKSKKVKVSLGTLGYWLRVRTGTRPNAGTDADIVFRLVGSAGTVQRRINGELSGLFERGSVDTVFIPGVDIGPAKELHVFNDGTGDGPDWFLDKVEVRRASDYAQPSEDFIFNRWVKANTTEHAIR